jgi:hypothetical protein
MINGRIWKRANGSYVINDGTYGVGEDSAISITMVEAYLAEHPEALIPEPLLPKPTQEEREAMERCHILVRLAEIDTLTIRPLRATLAGTQTKTDTAKLKELETESAGLRGKLKGLK